MRNTYVPAGSVAPGTCTGPLKVSKVRLLIVAPCAWMWADAAVTTRAAPRMPAPHEMMRVMVILLVQHGAAASTMTWTGRLIRAPGPPFANSDLWRGGRYEIQGLRDGGGSGVSRIGVSSRSGYERHAPQGTRSSQHASGRTQG